MSAEAEKVERLKAILNARAEHKHVPEYADEYKELRKELLANPNMKEALPRFVRTCASLDEFWQYIKEKGLLSYDSRRRFLREEFEKLILSLNASDDGTKREVFFPKGTTHDAYTHIRSILQTATTDLFIVDGYMDATIYRLLSTVPSPRLNVKFLTWNIPSDFTLEAKKFSTQHPHFTIELRKAQDFHDRFIFIDNAKSFLLGASIKDAGNRGFTVLPIEELKIVQFILGYANQVWDTASVIS